ATAGCELSQMYAICAVPLVAMHSMRCLPIQPAPRKPSFGRSLSRSAFLFIENERLHKTIRTVERGIECCAKLLKPEPVRKKRRRIDHTITHRLDSLAHSRCVRRQFPLMGVDHVQTLPIPKLHVHLAGAVLV